MEGGVGVIGKRTKMALHGIFDNNGRLREGSKVLGDFLVKLHESLKLDVLLLESFTWSTFYPYVPSMVYLYRVSLCFIHDKSIYISFKKCFHNNNNKK